MSSLLVPPSRHSFRSESRRRRRPIRSTITATLVRADGTTLPLDSIQAAGRDYASAAGKVYRVALPQALTAGSYRVIVESTLGRTTVCPRNRILCPLARVSGRMHRLTFVFPAGNPARRSERAPGAGRRRRPNATPLVPREVGGSSTRRREHRARALERLACGLRAAPRAGRHRCGCNRHDPRRG